jgi:hypothetical protein
LNTRVEKPEYNFFVKRKRAIAKKKPKDAGRYKHGPYIEKSPLIYIIHTQKGLIGTREKKRKTQEKIKKMKGTSGHGKNADLLTLEYIWWDAMVI